MHLAAGDRLGPYRIVGLIGKGGMGEVYRAHDSRLGRDVAIKVSSRQFSERFEREARAVAALNHPNICTLYDVGPNYLVMELVEGPTLAQRIKEGPLPFEEALGMARQITAALEAAHEKGITHRDLKPGNVKIKPDGLVKVLDFGLAKMEAPVVAGDPEESPTLTMMTEHGAVLGTAAYMSPEQARARPDVDKRADIWSFGVVFFEMLTRKRLFTGESATDVLAAVVNQEPDLRRAPAQTQRLLRRCLEKDPRKRLREISVVWELLEGGTDSPAQAEAHPTSRLPWVAAAVLGMVAVALGAMLWVKPAGVLQTAAYSVDEPAGARFVNAAGAVALSPDGRMLVFGATLPDSGLPGLWLRPLDTLEAKPLAGTERGNYPFWSPDSKSLAFFSGGDNKLKRIEVKGGVPVVLTDARQSAVSATGTWNRDGVILYGGPEGLRRVAASGGTSTPITSVHKQRKETGHGYPQFLPDGERFLYFVASEDEGVQGVYAASLGQPERSALVLRTGTKAVYVPPRADAPGALLWVQGQTLLAQRFDLDSLGLVGEPLPVAQGILINVSAPVRAAYWADGGTLVYRPDGGVQRAVLWKAADGKALGQAMPPDSVLGIRLSPDGQRLAVSRKVGTANPEIWLWEFARGGVYTRLTFDDWVDSMPTWSPDGRQVAFLSFRDGVGSIFRKGVSGTGKEERLTQGSNLTIPLDWSRDGKYLLYSERAPTTGMDLWALPLQGERKPILVESTTAEDNMGQISPDGRWIVYHSNKSGRHEVYVRPSPWTGAGSSGQWQVSDAGGEDPKWSADGKWIYYEAASGGMMAAAVRSVQGGFQTEAPRELFAAGQDVNQSHSFDVTADRRFIFLMPGEDAAGTPMNVIADWQAKLLRN